MIELSENTGINKYAIEQIKGKQPPYGPIYNLKPVELETLKTYIETHFKIGFIRTSKFLTGTSIFFNQKSDRNPHLYVNYKDLNNLIIKNWYLLLLIRKALDKLGWAKNLTQLDFINAYHQIRI